MKIVRTSLRWQSVGLLLVAVFSAAAVALADPPAKPEGRPAKAPDDAAAKLRPIRVAIFDVDVLQGVGVEGPAVTDQLNTMLSAMPEVTVVNRDQIKKVAEEHQIALSGLVESSSAVKLGKFLSAEYIVVGRASRIGPTFYLVLKIIDVETTEQTTVSAKASTENGFGTVLERLGEPLSADVRRLQQPLAKADDAALAELRKLAEPLAGKTIVLQVEETHVGRPLRDPAAQMAIMQRLRSLGLSVIVPANPGDAPTQSPNPPQRSILVETDKGHFETRPAPLPTHVPTPGAGWRESVLQTGKYADQSVDFLLEGEGTSAFAAQLHGLTSCRARVELRLIAVPGRVIATSDRGVAAAVDLVEALAAKSALEEAGTQACDAMIRRAASEIKQR